MKSFIWLGRAEGVSLLLLFFVAMPLKYLMDLPEAVRWVGSIHGGLFVAYAVWAALVIRKLGWGWDVLIQCLILSSLPFGTFYFERKLPRTLVSPTASAPKI